MSNHRPPEVLSPKHRLVALALAAGRSTRDIAQSVGISEQRISVLKQSPLFRALVEEELRHIREHLVSTVAERMNAEAARTLDRMVELRDQQKDLGVAARMTDSLADRIMGFPKKVSADDERGGRRPTVIQFSREEVQELLRGAAEVLGRPLPKAIPTAGATIPTRHRAVLA
jgi:hypothetical protein